MTKLPAMHWSCFSRMLSLVPLGLSFIFIPAAVSQATPLPRDFSSGTHLSSIKESPTGGNVKAFQMGGPGTISIKNASVKFLIEYAYNLQDFQLTGEPEWVDSTTYDVDLKDSELPPARAGEGGTSFEQQRRAMMRSLLEKRFHLRLIEGTKQTPVYALVVAQNFAKTAQRSVVPGSIISVRTTVEKGGLTMSGGSNSELAKVLAGQLGCPVEDKTQLDGTYDIALKWDSTSQASLISAVQEQLGLKLEEHIVPVATYAIDNVEKPVTD